MIIADELYNKITDIVNFIKDRISLKPDLGIILGSGLGELVDDMEDKIIIPYTDIVHIPNSTAPGHLGNLVIGKLKGKVIMAMQGRFHIYEGHNPAYATLLIRVFKLLGIDTLIITCAAGGLNISFKAGDIMLIADHINFSGTNPLLGENLSNFGPRFPGMFDIYTPKLQAIAHDAAINTNIRLVQGIYAGILGPAYATRAELQFLINNHCDAIGMSVVHEAIIAKHSGMDILGFAAITDMALPYSGMDHANEEEIIESGNKIQTKFKKLLLEIIENMPI